MQSRSTTSTNVKTRSTALVNPPHHPIPCVQVQYRSPTRNKKPTVYNPTKYSNWIYRHTGTRTTLPTRTGLEKLYLFYQLVWSGIKYITTQSLTVPKLTFSHDDHSDDGSSAFFDACSSVLTRRYLSPAFLSRFKRYVTWAPGNDGTNQQKS
jgi:hypothetical protein